MYPMIDYVHQSHVVFAEMRHLYAHFWGPDGNAFWNKMREGHCLSWIRRENAHSRYSFVLIKAETCTTTSQSWQVLIWNQAERMPDSVNLGSLWHRTCTKAGSLMWWGRTRCTVSGRSTLPSPLPIPPIVIITRPNVSLPLMNDPSIKTNSVEYYKSDWVKRTDNACYTCQSCSKRHKLSPL